MGTAFLCTYGEFAYTPSNVDFMKDAFGLKLEMSVGDTSVQYIMCQMGLYFTYGYPA